MSKWRFTIEVEVDDEALAEHDGDAKPPPGEVEDWYDSDLLAALTMGIAELEHADCVEIERLT